MSDDAFSLGITRVHPESACSVIVAMPPFLSLPTLPPLHSFIYLFMRFVSLLLRFVDALPIESVISMSPATVGLQYSREASRGQVVLLPATPAALGKSIFLFLSVYHSLSFCLSLYLFIIYVICAAFATYHGGFQGCKLVEFIE